MDKYKPVLSKRATSDLDKIYSYIVETFKDKNTAIGLSDRIANAILSLELYPYRGSERKEGKFAFKGYRQLFVDSYVVIYRICEENKTVIIITIQHSLKNM